MEVRDPLIVFVARLRAWRWKPLSRIGAPPLPQVTLGKHQRPRSNRWKIEEMANTNIVVRSPGSGPGPGGGLGGPAVA